MKKIFNLTSLAGTLLVFAFMWGISKIGIQFEFLNVIEAALKDFSLVEVYYQFREDKDVKFDDRIVLINIGDEPRSTVARQILTINKYKPAVIGIDALFYGSNANEQDSIAQYSGDNLMEIALAQAQNVVLVGELNGYKEKTNQWDSLHYPYQPFAANAFVSYANTVTDEDGGETFNTWKRIVPQSELKDSTKIDCFAAKIMSLYDSALYKQFIGRNNQTEDIYFKGNIPNADTTKSAKYTILDVQDVLSENFTPDVLKGKIVLMGYMGGEYTSTHWDTDKFYTPLNPKQVGRSWPDMYGVVIHANILSMILDNNYINVMPEWGSMLIAFIMCYFNVAIFVIILKRKRLAPWYGAISKIIQLIEAVLLTFLTIELFTVFHFKIDMTLAIVAVLLSGDLAEIFMDFIGNVFKLHKIEH